MLSSDVVTMDFLPLSGPLIPNVYGYSPTLDSVAEAGVHLYGVCRYTKLSHIWFDLGECVMEGGHCLT